MNAGQLLDTVLTAVRRFTAGTHPLHGDLTAVPLKAP